MAQIHKAPVPWDIAEKVESRAQALLKGVHELSLAPSSEQILRRAFIAIDGAIKQLEGADPETDKAKAACEKLLPPLREARQHLGDKPDRAEVEKAMKMAEDALRELNEAEKNEQKTPS